MKVDMKSYIFLSFERKNGRKFVFSKLASNAFLLIYRLLLNSITESPQNSEYIYLSQAQQTLNDLRQQYDIDLFAYIMFRNNEIFVSESKVAPDYKSIYDTYLKYEQITGGDIRDYAFK